MKKIISLSIMAVLLTACGGNKLDLDLEKVQSAVAEEALTKKSIEEGDYKAENIEVIKVCEAVERGEEDAGFNGQYLVYWQTDDSKFDNDFMMTAGYEIGYGTNRYKEIDDRCISVE